MKFLKPSFKYIEDKTLTSFIAFIYMIVIFAIYPFYMKNGYYDVGGYKFNFYLYSSLGAVLLLLLTGFIELIKSFSKTSITDVFLLLFLISTFISYLLSDYRTFAFLGADEWYLGLIFILLISMTYILLSRLWDFEIIIIYVGLLAAAIVFIIGLLDRFSIYLIYIPQRNPVFISTMGNINWFMGYYSVFVPLGVGLFAFELNKERADNKIRFYGLGMFTLISFCTGFAQGSESVFLVFWALFNVLIYLTYKEFIAVRNVIWILLLWSMSSQIVRFLKNILYYNYDADGLCGVFTTTNYLLIISILLIIALYLSTKNNLKINKKVFIGIILFQAIIIILWLILGIIKTNTDLIKGFNYSLLYFNENFGNFRGEIFKVSIKAFEKMPLKNKIFGVGPDCYKNWVYSINSLSNELRNLWPNDTLVNAHNEALTMLINEGIIGTFLYFSFFISFIIKNFKNSKNPIILCISLATTCYLVHNIVSFMQVLNTPFIFILMGMAKSLDFFDKKHD